jgi:hypothetical protein
MELVEVLQHRLALRDDAWVAFVVHDDSPNASGDGDFR